MRSKSEYDRIYGGKAKVDWMHAQPCHICGVRSGIQCAHAGNGGIGRKAGHERTVPLCWRCHHAYGTRYAFQRHTGQDMIEVALSYEARWVARQVRRRNTEP